MDFKTKKTERFDIQRKVVAHMTTKSWQQIPHVTYIYEPDITEFYREFQNLKRSQKKLTFNTLMLKVIAEGLKQAPKLNAHLEYHPKLVQGNLHLLPEINVSMPWLLEDGRMITPVVPHIGEKSLSELSAYMNELSFKIEKTDVDHLLYQVGVTYTKDQLKRFKFQELFKVFFTKKPPKTSLYPERLTEKDLLTGTVTVSNIGSLYKGQRGFLALLEIIPPQVFAVGMGAIQERPGIEETKWGVKKVGVRQVLPMCLAFDHRAVDFNELVPFLKALDQIFANPVCIRDW